VSGGRFQSDWKARPSSIDGRWRDRRRPPASHSRGRNCPRKRLKAGAQPPIVPASTNSHYRRSLLNPSLLQSHTHVRRELRPGALLCKNARENSDSLRFDKHKRRQGFSRRNARQERGQQKESETCLPPARDCASTGPRCRADPRGRLAQQRLDGQQRPLHLERSGISPRVCRSLGGRSLHKKLEFEDGGDRYVDRGTITSSMKAFKVSAG
jgi:hypothetical protein